MDKNITQLEFDASNNNKYEVEKIWDNGIYAIESEANHLPGLYYFINWKKYLKEKST